jgi:hypothetical protein
MKILKIQHPILDDSRITYGFFTRSGGISKKPYDTLNCSFNNEDASINVKENLELVRKELDLDTIIQLNQVHSTDIITLNNRSMNYNFKESDGLVTNLKGIGLSILGADCAPILFYDNVTNIIGACHAGWRGAVNNIIEKEASLREDAKIDGFEAFNNIKEMLNKSNVENIDIIFLAVKPQQMLDAIKQFNVIDIEKTLFISIAAGLSFSWFKNKLLFVLQN